ncbi:MAG: Smr/MutS family protein [Clostridia bacterium]|nr:Smr/MutS family protein [Clostridia bacterium]
MYVVGDYVKIKEQNIAGFVTAIKNNYVTILANDKIVKVAIENTEKAIPNKVQSNSVKINVKLSSPPLDEIMVRHQTVEEALFNLEKFIDNAICNNVKIVKIIHGKNGGILRREVHKFLDNSPYVKEHRLGGYYEGSYGVTIAFLK